jgi:hypothetical protein
MKPEDGECQSERNPIQTKKDIPRPPTIRTAGFLASAIFDVKEKKRSPRRFRRMKGGGGGEGREKGGGRTKWAKGNN